VRLSLSIVCRDSVRLNLRVSVRFPIFRELFAYGPRLQGNSPESIAPVKRTDQELIAATVNGQTEAFDCLVLRYQDRLFNALVQILRDREEARDTVQESFVTAWRKLENFRGDSGFYSWLFRVAYNTAMSRQRKKKLSTVSNDAENAIPVADPHQDNRPSHQLELAERQKTVRTALNNLPEEYRTVLILKEMEDFKYEQIAQILDVPIGTIRSRIHRARHLLREGLQRLLVDYDERPRAETT